MQSVEMTIPHVIDIVELDHAQEHRLARVVLLESVQMIADREPNRVHAIQNGIIPNRPYRNRRNLHRIGNAHRLHRPRLPLLQARHLRQEALLPHRLLLIRRLVHHRPQKPNIKNPRKASKLWDKSKKNFKVNFN